MRKGQICRRTLNDGTPIGPYLKYIEKDGNFRKVQPLTGPKCEGNPEDPSYAPFTVSILHKNIREVGVAKIQLTDSVYDRIEKGIQNKVIHELTSAWASLDFRWTQHQIQLVQVRSFQYSTKTMLFIINDVQRKTFGVYREIWLYLGPRIL